MSEPDPKILELEARLDSLMRTQIDFQVEVTAIRKELSRLRNANIPPVRKAVEFNPVPPVRPETPRPIPQPTYEPPLRPATDSVPPPSFGYSSPNPSPHTSQFEDSVSKFFAKYTESARSDLENFIGENLISKIGILILIIGIGIGVKYSIDNNLISPLTRIIIGYIFGFGLVGLAIKLKAKYHNFSAVLISGGMATMYFVTYFAYSLYSLIPQITAFGLMAKFTLLTVSAALFYNRQVIAHIGLVGAYAVPFLLSNNSGNYLFLFIYMAMLNAGILAISLRKDWKPLFYTASAFTWLIFAGWLVSRYVPTEHFYLAITFLGVFFSIFYAIKLIPLLSEDNKPGAERITATIATVGIFFAFSLAISVSIAQTIHLWAFFSFLAVSSLAILLTSYKSIGKWLIYLVYPASWFIFVVWFFDRYDPSLHFQLAAIFASVFFVLFYSASLAYRLMSEDFEFIENAGCVLTNSFLYYGLGYSILDGSETTSNFLGVYTAAHGLFHLGVAQIVNRLKPAPNDVVQVLTILILTFASIVIPVQFDGNFVTVIWAAEAAFLFWMGRTRGVKLFECFAYPVMALACMSLLADWTLAIGEVHRPIVNGNFITALVVVAAFAFIFIVNRDEQNEAAIPTELIWPLGYVFAVIAVFVFYNAFRIEIGNYYDVKKAVIESDTGSYGAYVDLGYLNIIWQINYTLFFLAVMGIVNQLRLRSRSLALVNSVLAVVVLFLFSTVVMYLFSELRFSFQRFDGSLSDRTNLAIRYISYIFAGGMIFVLYRYVRDELLHKWLNANSLLLIFEAVFYLFVFIVASCELVNLMGQYYLADATKLGLTIFWGVYALAMIVLGIAWDKKHLRVAAIVLLGVTLAKLFFYDISELGTIPKTILFVTLGITLLVISFLYTKYKNTIFPAQVQPDPETFDRSVTDL